MDTACVLIFNVHLECLHDIPLCTGAEYQTGDVQLMGGSYQWEGRVEIYMSGTWGIVTDSQWSSDDAAVVCRKLGHFKQG